MQISNCMASVRPKGLVRSDSLEMSMFLICDKYLTLKLRGPGPIGVWLYAC
jgi:hypothetical protein